MRLYPLLRKAVLVIGASLLLGCVSNQVVTQETYPISKTSTDYIARINLVKSSFLDTTWDSGGGRYQTADPIVGTIRPYTWLNIFMVQTTAILAGRGIATGTDIARAVAVIDKLVSSPCYVNNTWTHLMTGDSDYHAAVDQPVAECLFYAYKYRVQLGLSSDTITAIYNILTFDLSNGGRVYGGSSLNLTGEFNNQDLGKWQYNRLTYGYLAGNTSLASSLSACIKRFLYYADQPFGGSNNGSNALSGLFSDWGWRYIDAMPWQSLEYGEMSLGAALLYYPDIASVAGLTADEILRMKAWQRQNLGMWQRSGYPNWDTTWSNGRQYSLSYWLWSLRALSGMVRGATLTMNANDAGNSKWMLDKAVDTVEYMDGWNSDPIDHAVARSPMGVPFLTGGFEGDTHYNNIKANGMAKFIMELAVAVDLGIADVTAIEPITIWGWNWNTQDVHISTSTYSAASLPYAPNVNAVGWYSDAVQSPGDGVSRIQLPTNEILTNMGGYDQEAHSFKIVRSGTTEINTGSISVGKPTSQQIWRDGVEQTRVAYDTQTIPTDFATSIKSLVKRNGTNYRSEVETEFFQSYITTTHRAVRTGTAGTGQAVISFPCRKNVVMDYVQVSGAKTVIWNGVTVNIAGSPDPSVCKYIHMKWASVPGSGITAGIILIPTSAVVAAGAKVTALSYNPNGYPERQPDQDRSLLIYLADGASSMGDVNLTYDVKITDGTDAGASLVANGFSILSANATTPTTTLTGTKQSTLTIEGVSGATFGTVTYPADTTFSIPLSGLIPGDNVIVVRAMDSGVEVGRVSATVSYNNLANETATIQPANATGSVTALTATASSMQAFMTLKGINGATFPMYITGNKQVGLQF